MNISAHSVTWGLFALKETFCFFLGGECYNKLSDHLEPEDWKSVGDGCVQGLSEKLVVWMKETVPSWQAQQAEMLSLNGLMTQCYKLLY